MQAGDLGRGIGAGEIDPVALTQCYLDAIAAHPDSDRIYARTTPQRALAEAEAAAERARLGTRRHPLDGVPISWKDLFDSAGTATEAGSALLKGHVPDRDALVLRNATQAGLICLGKTHMSELAFSGIGINPVTATPPNVNDPALAPGGSSSGAATSVAFGLAAGGIGSDTGGSVRIPAAWNNLVGFKTTSGRISLEGVQPLCKRFDTIGPLARSVQDCTLLLSALEGRPAPDLRGVSPRGLRLGVLRNVAFDSIRDAPLAAFDAAAARLQDAGARLTDITVPALDAAMPLSALLFASEGYGLWKDRIEAAPDLMFPQILERFRAGAQVSAPDYVAGWEKLYALRAEWQAATAGFDAVICPTAPILPPDVARMLSDEDYYITENLLALRNTRIGNLMGLPAVSLPTPSPACGLMLMGQPLQEERLARVAAAAEPVVLGAT
ncbi:2-amino-5-chloromuconic acid deaminase [Pseudooceanicola algae]|uniref:2-amino-5-chloromuconic acid deaminase n=2 Tax=Pseudooceanicola algae TaxID=1537215 RepID=A0A418SG18_9RHOB|nr:2-amino-5-chloromuconic acid deaminase [Pseudooceanicola algae]